MNALPQSELRSLADDLWVVDRPFRMFGTHLGVRMSVVRVPGEGLLLHSPIAPDEDWVSAVRQLGEVRWLVGPSQFHNLYMPAAAREFPEAEVLGCPGFERIHPDLSVSPVLEAPGVQNAFGLQRIGGMPKVEEVVMCHRASGTLLVADLVFNIPGDAPFLTRSFFRLNGGVGRVTRTKIFRSRIRQPEAYRASIDAVLDWDFDRIVLSHGNVVERGGKEALRDVHRTG